MANYEAWSPAAPKYSSNVGRTSAFAADRQCQLANELSHMTSTSRVLDNGAGTGAITFAVASQFPATQNLTTDNSVKILDNISRAELPKVETPVLDARSLRPALQEKSFTHAFNVFMLQTIINPSSAVREMYAVLAASRVIGIAIWGQRNGPFEVWERACPSLDPSYKLPLPFDDPHAWRTCDELARELKVAGFIDLKTVEMTMPFPFERAEDFSKFWFGAKNPAPEKCMGNWKGDWEALKLVCREEYADGRDICTSAVIGLGRKAEGV